MNKLLDLLDRIREGAPAPLGFGVTRPEKLPGMALIGLVSQNYAKGMALVVKQGLDAAMVAGADGPEGVKQVVEGLEGKPWGARVTSLSQEEAQAYQDNGSDLPVFPLEGTAASALANEEIAHILCIEPNMEDRELRAVSSLPVDCYLLPLSQTGDSLTLSDLAAVGSVSRRSDKFILLEVSRQPNAKDLEALRDIGVHGLVMDVEGMSLWLGENGGGYLVVSAQAADRFVVYDRAAPHAVRGVIRIVGSADGAIDGVSHTDGLDVTSAPLPGYPRGILVVQDDGNPASGVDQNFKIVDWADVEAALGLPR